MPSLFQAVQGLEKAQNTARIVFMIARWVAHVEDFIRLKFPIEIHTLDMLESRVLMRAMSQRPWWPI